MTLGIFKYYIERMNSDTESGSGTDHRAFKDDLYDQFARIGRAVANGHRLELLDLLAQGERRVDDLAQEAGLPVANASQHLQVLRRARMVEVRREGTALYYRVADGQVVRFWQAMRALGETLLVEIEQLVRAHVSERAGTEDLDSHTLWQRINAGDVTVIDVRPSREYAAGHLPTAISIPVDVLAGRLHELPRDLQIVAYCRGPYCVFADEAVALLEERGYQAARLSVGFPDWREAGLPVER